ncbi:hypothetical protein [Nocardiopsis suaedae]|uniref:Uncharacterized protein n=1 Tax=Nocardiopsis suaedae TaxID=3018444 RepID=A0ABT4TV45_9ACTN|nr:hypothetical protein [Nocardiopsis suaedae]MDA2808558.1 hypothetical protein [Nocardiopsis suaedae]
MSWTGVWAVGAVPWAEAEGIAEAFSQAAAAGGDDALSHRVLDLMAPVAGAEPFVATARKADPAAALLHALGADGPNVLPGVGGNFILSPDEVGGAVTALAAVAEGDDEEVRRVRAEAAAWMDEAGDEPGFRPGDLLTGPLAAMRTALGRKSAVAGVSQRY